MRLLCPIKICNIPSVVSPLQYQPANQDQVLVSQLVSVVSLQSLATALVDVQHDLGSVEEIKTE